MDKKDNRSSEREPEGNSFDYEELVNEPAEDQGHPLRSIHSTGRTYPVDLGACGEVPKRLKGLPWKGSRSLIAARGFKSLLLRLIYLA